MHDVQIIPIPAFDDNYIWLIHNNKLAIVIDPGDAAPVLATLTELQLSLVTILITHHHYDHIDGVADLLKQYPQTQVYAPTLEHYPFEHTAVSEATHSTITALGIDFSVLDCPGHTQDHIAYYAQLPNHQYWLLSGDVIFAAGCGFVPEGSYALAYQALQKIAALPQQTQIFCTHEYTLNNIQFALTIEPNNLVLLQRLKDTLQRRQLNQPTLPTSVGLELETNPYLRCNQHEIIHTVNIESPNNLSIFTAIRKLKNSYKSINYKF